MGKQAIYIRHLPTNTLLCKNGIFLPFYSACGCKDDTVVYKTVGAAENRFRCVQPGKRFRSDIIKDLVLEMVIDGKVYRRNPLLSKVFDLVA